jgi:CTD small phosphatase-like protein 2
MEENPLPAFSEPNKDNETNITSEELATFAVAFKDKIRMSDYIAEQFSINALLPPVTSEMIAKLAVKIPPPKTKKLTNKTLVLDLDNTLVYVMTAQAFDSKKVFKDADVRSAKYIDTKKGITMELRIIIRPYAIEMLKQLTTYYEIIIFTAANKAYGDAVIDELDPTNTLIDYRLYRDSCIRSNSSYVKDLRILDRKMESMVMVDDSIASFSSHLENGIFIPPFAGGEPDNELGALWIFLRQITSATDVRVPIAAKYNLSFFYKMFSINKAQK